MHSPSYEEEGTELRFISCCIKMHIGFFSGGLTNPRLDDRKIANLLQQGFGILKLLVWALALMFSFLFLLKEPSYASRSRNGAHYMCRSISATR